MDNNGDNKTKNNNNNNNNNNSNNNKNSNSNMTHDRNNNGYNRTNNNRNIERKRTSSKSFFSKERAITKTNFIRKIKERTYFVDNKTNMAFKHFDLGVKNEPESNRSNSMNGKPIDDSSTHHDGPYVNGLRPKMKNDGPNITNIRNNKTNNDDTNTKKNEPAFTIELSVLVAIILLLALFVLPCFIYKAKSLHKLSKNKPTRNDRQTMSGVCIL